MHNPPVTSPPDGAAGLSVSLATNQSSYVVGQSVQITLTATNNSDQDVTIWVGPTANVFSVTQDGKVVWTRLGPTATNPSVAKVLKPGDSLTLTTTWKAAEVGTFVVANSLAPQGPVATFSVSRHEPSRPRLRATVAVAAGLVAKGGGNVA